MTEQILRKLLVGDALPDHQTARWWTHPFWTQDGSIWRSVVDSSIAPEQGANHALGLGRALLDSQFRDRGLVACIADPRSSLVTLVRSMPEQKEKLGEALRSVVTGVFERFIQHARGFRDKLSVRPGLCLVLVSGSNPEVERNLLREVYHGALRHLGETTPDLDLRWMDRRGLTEADAEFWAGVLSAHAPRAPEGVTLNWNPGDFEAARIARELLDPVVSRPVASLRTACDALLQATGQILPQGDVETLRHAGTRRESRPGPATAPQMLFGARVAVRQWTAQALRLPLLPITLISSENASGKTSFTEAIGKLYLNRSRLRTPLPDRADTWSNLRDHVPPAVAVLRVQYAERDLRSNSMLPLFSDDADLFRGTPGDTDLLTWWSFPETGDLRELFGLEDRVRELALDQTRSDPSPAFLEESVDVGTLVLRDVEDRLSDIYSRRVDPGEKARENGTKEDEERRQIRKEKARRLLDQAASAWRAQTAPGSRGVTPAPRRGSQDNNAYSLPLGARRTRAFLLQYLRRRGNELKWIVDEHQKNSTASEAWNLVRELAANLGLDAVVAPIAALVFETLKREYLERLTEWSKAVAHLVAPDLQGSPDDPWAPQVDRIWRYLDTSMAARPLAEVRPNTARQVARGQAERLARWLACSNGNLPVLVFDEPTLGQDGPTGARNLLLYMRLRRAFEADIWLSMPREVPHLLTDEWRQDLSAPTMPPIESRHLGGDTRIGPSTPAIIGPQIVVSSYHTDILSSVAAIEGVVLTQTLTSNLQKLVPIAWHADLQAELERIDQESRKLDLFEEGDSIPASFVRLQLDVRNVARTIPESSYVDRACTALRTLGLHGLAFEVCSVKSTSSDIARRLLWWLAQIDVLPAAFGDMKRIDPSGIGFRSFPAVGGFAEPLGPTRLRRVGGCSEILPPDPFAPRMEQSPGLEPVVAATKGAFVSSVHSSSEEAVDPEPRDQPAPVATMPPSGEPAAHVIEYEDPAEMTNVEPTGAVAADDDAAPDTVDVPVRDQDLDALSSTEATSSDLVPIEARATAPALIQDSPASTLSVPAPHADTLPSSSQSKEAPAAPTLISAAARPSARLRVALDEHLVNTSAWPDAVATAGAAPVAIDDHPEVILTSVIENGRRASMTSTTGAWTRSVRRPRELPLLLMRETLHRRYPQGVAADPIPIGIATHVAGQVTSPDVVFNWNAVEPPSGQADEIWNEAVLVGWREYIENGLIAARVALDSVPFSRVTIYPRCHAGAAIRAGSIFHFQSGFSVVVNQLGPRTDPAYPFWNVDHRVSRQVSFQQEAQPLRFERQAATDPSEIHLLVSVTHSVRAEYERWLAGRKNGVLVEATLEAGTPDRAALDESDVVSAADQIARQVMGIKDFRRLPKRIFIAAPNALAVALGRAMNAWGRVITMDLSKLRNRYFESFVFDT